MKRFNMRLLLLAIPILAITMNANADFINGYGWVTLEGDVNTSTGGSPATLALATCHNGSAACTTANADVTFTTTGINLDSRVNSSTSISGWLATSLFTLNSLAFHNGVNGATTAMDPTIWEFTGTASFTNGQTFTFTHDDGVTMIVNGVTYVNQPGLTAPITSTATYTGPTGNESFDIIYAECCSPPAVLQTTLVGPTSAPVPEPSTWMILSAGLLGIARYARTKSRSRA